MKKRWASIAWPSLVCLVAMSWLASRYGTSTWDLIGISLVGTGLGCAVTFFAMVRNLRARWPAVVAFLGGTLLLCQAVMILRVFGELYPYYGVPLVLLVVGSIAASAASLIVAIRRLPPLPAPAPIAAARLVEHRSREES